MKILVVKLSSLGDLFHALPAVHTLKVRLEAEIHWVAQHEYVELVRCFTDVGRVIPFHRKHFFRHLTSFLGDLRQETYDYVIDFQGLLKSAVVTRLARGRKKIGPSFCREGTGCFYSAVAGKRNKDRHAVEECLDVVGFLGLQPMEPEFPVKFPQMKVEERRPRVAVVPASRWESKNWPVRRFAAVLKRLRQEREASIFLMGGSEDADCCQTIMRELNGEAVNMVGKISLPEAGGLLKEMDLLLANDSGPIHMAAAAGTPTLVVFGPTDAKRTGPYGRVHRIAVTALPCRPCFSRACPKRPPPCLSTLSPDQVAEIALDMLKNYA